MTESTPTPPIVLADRAQSLATTLLLSEAALAGTVLDWFDRLELMLAIKEVGTSRYVHVSRAMASLFGCRPQQMLGSTDAELRLSPAGVAWRSIEASALAPAGPTLSELRIDSDGQRREFQITRLPLAAIDDGPSRHVACVWSDVTGPRQQAAQLHLALTQLEQQQTAAETLRRETQDHSMRDVATGLYQRVHFDDLLRREIDLSSREHREFALVSIALDPLAERLLALGPAAGERVFEALGRQLRNNTRAMDASCRLDETHFAVLLSGVGLATAHSRMEGLRRQCATQIVVLDGRELGFTVSMGVASFPHTAGDQDELMRASDQALAEARRRGGNHVALASIRFDAD